MKMKLSKMRPGERVFLEFIAVAVVFNLQPYYSAVLPIGVSIVIGVASFVLLLNWLFNFGAWVISKFRKK